MPSQTTFSSVVEGVEIFRAPYRPHAVSDDEFWTISICDSAIAQHKKFCRRVGHSRRANS